MSRRHRIAVAALLAAVPALLPAPALAAKKAKPKAAATARFEVVRVDLRGERLSRTVDDQTVYDYRGIARYETSVDSNATLVVPPPAKRRLPSTLVVRGLEYNGVSDAKITMNDGAYDCSMVAEGIWSPESFAAVVAFRGPTMFVNWQLAAPPMRCPREALVWSLDTPPSSAYVNRYKVADLLKIRRGREKRLPVRIDAKWSNDYDGPESFKWTGYVQVKRVR